MRRRDRGSPRAARNSPRQMQRGGLRRPARQDEAPQRREVYVHRIDLTLESLDLRRHDPQHHVGRRKPVSACGSREVGTKVEQIVLNPLQRHGERIVAKRHHRQTNGGVRLIDIADRCISALAFDTREPSTSPVVPSSPVRV